MHKAWDWIDDALADLTAKGLRRSPVQRAGPQAAETTLAGRPVLNFSSNDYLGLAADPRLAEAVRDALRDSGWGSGASPVVTGRSAWHERLEQALADFEGTDAALLFSSGYVANLTILAALVGPQDCVFGDHDNHASLIDGCRLSGARFRSYRHSDLTRLEELLQREPGRKRLIVSDTLFSMEGDLADVPALCALADKYDAMLLLDEAHATGVFGPRGRGLAELAGPAGENALRIGTLSKAFGCSGGFVCGSQRLIEWLRHAARGYFFSTAFPAAHAAAACAAVRIVQHEPERRERLLATAATLREQLRQDGWALGRSASQILPLIVGTPERALDLAAKLQAVGIWVPAIRPPSVPLGTSRLRVSLTSAHTPEMLAKLRDSLEEMRPARIDISVREP